MMNWVNGGSGMMAGMGLWGLLVLVTVLLLLALAGLGGIWLVRRLRDEPAASPSLSGDAAGNKLRERFAAGEIDEEYERRLSALTTGVKRR